MPTTWCCNFGRWSGSGEGDFFLPEAVPSFVLNGISQDECEDDLDALFTLINFWSSYTYSTCLFSTLRGLLVPRCMHQKNVRWHVTIPSVAQENSVELLYGWFLQLIIFILIILNSPSIAFSHPIQWTGNVNHQGISLVVMKLNAIAWHAGIH